MLGERLGGMEPVGSLAALGIASAQLAMLHAWVSGEFSLSVSEIAAAMVETSRLADRFSSQATFEVTARHEEAAAHHYARLGGGAD